MQYFVLINYQSLLSGAVEYTDCFFAGEVPAVLELWGMQSTPSLPLLSGPL